MMKTKKDDDGGREEGMKRSHPSSKDQLERLSKQRCFLRSANTPVCAAPSVQSHTPRQYFRLWLLLMRMPW